MRLRSVPGALLLLLSGLESGCFGLITAVNVLGIQKRDHNGNGHDDNGSDSDSNSQKCRDGVCTTRASGTPSPTATGNQNAKLVTSTTVSNTRTSTKGNASSTATSSTATRSTTPASSSAAQTSPATSSTGKKGLGIGGIVGLAVGAAVLAGLLFMFILKRRENRRQKQNRPRGTMLLTPVNTGHPKNPSAAALPSDSEMVESTFSTGVVALHPSASHPDNFSSYDSAPPSPYFDNYTPRNLRTDLIVDEFTNQQAVRLADIETTGPYRPAYERVAALASPPSLHASQSRVSLYSTRSSANFVLGPMSSSVTNQRNSMSSQRNHPRALIPSVTHSEMVNYQKALEFDDAKNGEAVENRQQRSQGPPPNYSDS